jgi:adenine-specific DNA-methyltransferase
MANQKSKSDKKKTVVTLTHEEAARKNIPTVEYQSVIQKEHERPKRITYPRGVAGLEEEKQGRNRDLDPQLVWLGKDEQNWSDLMTHAPPIYIQEKVHPKVLIDDLMRRRGQKPDEEQYDLFADFNGVPDGNAKTEFYQRDANWSNRMILGDSLQVMASLAEREGLRGQVQCVYIDPPYGIKFNSNFQWSTTSRDVRDGHSDHITREPEQVKAFRDTWRNGIHSYLTYLRDRVTVARDLLTPSGSIFVQIGDENVHLVRSLLDEVFGSTNCASFITYKTTSGAGSFAGGTDVLAATNTYLLWYARDLEQVKYRQLFRSKDILGTGGTSYRHIEYPDGVRSSVTSQIAASPPEGCRLFGITLVQNRRLHE